MFQRSRFYNQLQLILAQTQFISTKKETGGLVLCIQTALEAYEASSPERTK
jgi:hypothetical protein